MTHALGSNVGSHNGSLIIQGSGGAICGRRWKVQCLKPAFPGGCFSNLGKCSSRGGGDETYGHQQTEGFSVVSHKAMVLLALFRRGRPVFRAERCNMR